MNTTAVILAGGKSSRMGTNKALLTIEGKTVIEGMVEKIEPIVDDMIIVTNTFEEYEFLQLPMIEDKWKGMGPLAGIEAGLSASKTDRNLIIACDMPFISTELGTYLLSCLEDYQAAVPEVSGQLHPLFASYRKEVHGAVTQSLEQNQLRIRHLLHSIHVKIVKEELLQSLGLPNEEIYFFNMNDRDEYQKAFNMSKDKGGTDQR
ncbi:molybdenum cofactor guanylyltransferase [Bacillus sp. V3B]|uniref:molybdenum cofactor guanylyltransferase n=1 Tax=Bacillus sp. V3B TaxID=2804915 RepID=UPI00210C79E9|nr:molybdenum cofactor guanylyltransferase [Bacillus sp. V3B]MCQ6274537.1 molybdenum cofactor guanylyltransferase [Bacillus sp. V3B]